MTTTITLSTEDYQALLAEQQRLANQLRLVTVERDLLKERVDAFLHKLYAAKSEARANPAQRDLFLNEAEALAPNGTPVAEEAPEACSPKRPWLGWRPPNTRMACRCIGKRRF
jgi:hypothetical protein